MGRQRNTRGAVLILVAFGMVLFFGVAAMVVDIGRVFVERNRLQAATEAAAVAGGQALGAIIAAGGTVDTLAEYTAKQAAVRIASQNGITLNFEEIVVTGDRVFVYKPQTVEYTFARIIGFEQKEVAGNAVAKVSGDGSVSIIKEDRYNVMPWAMPMAVVSEPYNVLTRNVAITPVADLTPGNEYILKLGGGPQAGGLYYPLGTQVLIPMGGTLGNWDQWTIGFKRAYGLTVWLASQNRPVKWLLGYRGGSFMFDFDPDLMRQLGAMSTGGSGEFGSQGIFIDPAYFQWVKYEIHTDVTNIINQTTSMIVVDQAPRIGVYSSNLDAVTRTMDDAGIPYTMFHDNGVLSQSLAGFDWLHIHHEDFTGGGQDGGLEVPALEWVNDYVDTGTEGPVGGTLTIRARGFKSYGNGQNNIKVWFHNTQMYLTNTGTYSNDYVHPDHMMVNADDYGRFEVTVTVPLLPNGTYKVYAQVLDEYTNYLDYTIVGSSINPRVVVTDGSGDPLLGPNGGTITVEGSGFGPSSDNITVRMGGTIQTCTTTARYPDDAIVDGFIVATPGGSFEVSFPVPGLFSDGTYEVYGQIELVQSNKPVYTIENYLHPKIILSDHLGDPLRGPDGGTITVTGYAYRPGQSGINIRMGGSSQNVQDTLTYEGDAVVGYTDITANNDGWWQVTFTAPELPEGEYSVYAMHTDPFTGGDVLSDGILYYLQDSDNLTAEIYVSDLVGNPVEGDPGTTVTINGQYFAADEEGIQLWLFSDPQRLTVTDSGTLPGDEVYINDPDPLPLVRADAQGQFSVSFVLPQVDYGTHEVRALHTGGTLWTDGAFYRVNPTPKQLLIRDDAEPMNAGLAGGLVTVEGVGFPAGASPLKLYFQGQVMNPINTSTYFDDVVSGTDITANAAGSFEVQFHLPYWPEGVYRLQVLGDEETEISETYQYSIQMAEDFWTCLNDSFSANHNAFVISDTLHLKAMNTRVDFHAITRAEAVLTCSYHGTHTVTVPLASNDDYSHQGSIEWSAVPGVHNGDWMVAFYLEDSFSNSYTPVTTVHLTGVANVLEGAVISRNSNFSTNDVPLKVTEKQYFKIQSPTVDYSSMRHQYFRFACQSSFNANGWNSGVHNSGERAYTNNWDGTWTGSYQCPMPDQHTGDYVVKQYVEDTVGREYESIRNVVFFPWNSKYLLLSSYQFYDYEVNEFYKYGMFYARTFSRSPYVNYLDMNRAEYKYTKYKSGTDPTTGYYPLVNEGNMIFHVEENLGPHQDHPGYTSFKIYTYIKDNANNQLYTSKTFALRNTVSSSPLERFRYYARQEGVGEALAHTLAHTVRQLTAMGFADSPLRDPFLCIANRAIYVDGRQDECSPYFGILPDGIDGESRPPTARPWLASFFHRDSAEGCGCDETSRLIAAYHATPGPVENRTWWAEEHRPAAADPYRSGMDRTRDNWFARLLRPEPAHAAVYTGKYDVVHAIRNYVLNGGYMFAMCYGTETMDITLAKDNQGNWIGYDFTFAFENFAGGSIDDNDGGDFTLADMANSGDPYDRPLAIIQDHMTTLPGYTGATTSFCKSYIKANTGPGANPIYVCANVDANTVKYLGGAYGDGWFTFLAGHDPRLIEVYRLILDNILIGSLSSTIPSTTNANYVVLDMDNTDDGEDVDKAQYQRNIQFGWPPSLWGDIVPGYPGDLSDGVLVDTLPYNFPDETSAAVEYLVQHDLDRAEAGEIHTWRTPEAASSRYVLVPVCSVYKADGSVTYSQPQNLVDPQPTNVYEILGRDKVRIMRYALFYLSQPSGFPSPDPDLNELGSLKPGEVRGKFIGWLR